MRFKIVTCVGGLLWRMYRVSAANVNGLDGHCMKGEPEMELNRAVIDLAYSARFYSVVWSLLWRMV